MRRKQARAGRVGMESGGMAMVSAKPSGRELVALARIRLRDELQELAALPPDELRRRLLQVEPETLVTRGALVHAIRAAADADEDALAQALFVALIRRIEGLTRSWVRRTVLSAGLDLAPEDWREVASDLAQEQTLRLWDAIACGDDAGWELFFSRALAFAQGHLAEAWLRRARPRVSGQVVAPPLSLSRWLDDDSAETGYDALVSRAAPLGASGMITAELADLRALVERLPERERIAVVLRFWVGAGEDTIAQALGGVTTRTVRNTLTRAYARLRAGYSGGDGAAATPGAGE